MMMKIGTEMNSQKQFQASKDFADACFIINFIDGTLKPRTKALNSWITSSELSNFA